MITLFFIIFTCALILGIPIAFSIILTSMIFLLLQGMVPLSIVPQKMITGLDSFTLLALPFFILAGDLMAYGTTQRLMKLANVLLGHIRGGLASIVVTVSVFFGAISGSGVATGAAIGTILGPEMEGKGYKKGFTAALLAGSGTLGMVIPPSVAMVVFGVAAGVSIGDLFLAGVIPGLLTALFLIIYAIWTANQKGYEAKSERANINEFLPALKGAILPLAMPGIILGGIFTGVFTPTESATVACVYAFILSVFVYRELSFRDLAKVILKSAKTSSIILFIMSAATPFAWIISTERLPQSLADLMLGITTNQTAIVLLMMLMILILGTFMETSAIILILAPIVMPIISQIGVEPVHFGIMMVIGLAIGGVTPPLAVNLITSTKVLGIGMEEAVPEAMQVVLVMTLALIVVVFIPQLSLWLPNLLQ